MKNILILIGIESVLALGLFALPQNQATGDAFAPFLFLLFLILYVALFPILYMVFTLLHAKMTGNLSIYFLSFVPIFLYTLITFSIDGLTTAKSNPDSSNFGWFLVISGARLVISMVCFFTAFLVYRITTRNKRNQVATNDSQA